MINKIKTSLGFMDTILKFLKKYGFLNILKAMIIFLLLSITIRLALNPTSVFKSYTTWVVETHKVDLINRRLVDSNIKELLPLIKDETNSDRVWIVEYHNGTSNWTHATLKFECKSDSIPSVILMYDNFYLSWISLPDMLSNKEAYFGAINDLRSSDPVLSEMVSRSGVEYFGAIQLTDKDNTPLGILGLTWNSKDIINSNIIENKLYKYGAIASVILSRDGQ